MSSSIPANSIPTYTGRPINPLAVMPDQIDVRDIAHALSQRARWSGHTREFWSVAEHSLLVADILEGWDNSDPDLLLWGLLHDAAEAYLPDVATPIKGLVTIEAGVGRVSFAWVEQCLLRAIAGAFGLAWPVPVAVKQADRIATATEARDLFAPPVRLPDYPKPMGRRISGGWPMGETEELFLERFEALQRGRFRAIFDGARDEPAVRTVGG